MDVDVTKYQKLSEIEHIIARPGIYVGSIANTIQDSWSVEDNKMVNTQLSYNPGLLKLFDEILSNSVDEHIRSGNVKNIWVDVYPMIGEITIKDDGGIPVVKHPEFGTYIPEMIFGELRTGSNFSDDERATAGMNGLGSKLTSVFSKVFKVDTCDGKKRFVQVFKNNLSEKGKAVIQPCTDKGTTISFIPDYERLNCELDDDNLKKIEKRVYDIAGCNPKIKVFFNKDQIRISKFSEYVEMFEPNYVIDQQPDFEIALAASSYDGFKQVSFVNGVDTYGGGTHVDYVLASITAKVREFIKKKHKVDVKPNVIKQQMFLIMKCSINAPAFNSQTKEFMCSEVRNYGTSYTPSDKFIKKLLESEVVQKVLDWVEGEKRRAELSELRKLNSSVQNTNFLKRIVKFDDATGKDRSVCSLYLTEGDSASKTILSARNAAVHGTFPLKGKPLNVRDIEVKKLAANEEFQNIIAIMGLKIGVKVKDISDLRFSKLIMLTDSDPDGMHISGLLFNMINEFWPELFELGVICRLNTPLIVAKVGKKEYEFFNMESYLQWAATVDKHTKHYYKGLGGFSTLQFKKFLNNEKNYLVRVRVLDATDVDALNTAFDKNRADERKEWLKTS